jgi:hypothetical protein
MSSWSTYFFVKGMTFYNGMMDWISSMIYHTVDFGKYIKGYFDTDYTTWYLLPEHSLPLSHKHIKNSIYPRWKYSATRHLLTQSNNTDIFHCYRLEWLSSNVMIQSQQHRKIEEYSMDDFLEKVRICSDGLFLPTLRELFLIWCIHTHHWFSAVDAVIFNIIDSNGDLLSYSIDDPSICFMIHNKKMRIGRISENCIQ